MVSPYGLPDEIRLTFQEILNVPTDKLIILLTSAAPSGNMTCPIPTLSLDRDSRAQTDRKWFQ